MTETGCRLVTEYVTWPGNGFRSTIIRDWCLPLVGGEFVAAMEDVLDLYEEEYDPQYPTVCLDEKPVVLHADVHPPVPVEPGQPERVVILPRFGGVGKHGIYYSIEGE
jgi:hypothetical protein